MALKVVCDKCNKILSPADEITTLTFNETEKRYDFCEKCFENFINWFNSKEDSDETTD